MTTTCLLLIDGVALKKEALMISLSNAKQLVVGNAFEFGWIVHVAANSQSDLGKALLAFGKITGVKSVLTVGLHKT